MGRDGVMVKMGSLEEPVREIGDIGLQNSKDRQIVRFHGAPSSYCEILGIVNLQVLTEGRSK